MHFDPGAVIRYSWLAFLAYWLLSSFRVNRMQRTEPKGQKWLRILAMAASFWLLYGNDWRFGALNLRILPYRPWIPQLGAALTAIGVAFAIWARYHLGKYWSASVALREGHQLIRTGPYARIRHPIYTGMLLAVFGTALAESRYRALVAFVIVLLGLAWKAKSEEALLASQFGAEFEEHRRHTGFLLPRLVERS